MSKGLISKSGVLLVALSFVFAMAPAALAGGFQLAVDTPQAGGPANDAVLLVRTFGCHQPADAKVSARAEGLMDGKRSSIALDLKPSGTGVYAVKQQWPSQGDWVLVVDGSYSGMNYSLLIEVGPNGKVHPDTHLAEGNLKGTHVRGARQEWSKAAIEAALKTPGSSISEETAAPAGGLGTGTLVVAGAGTSLFLAGLVALRLRNRQNAHS